MMKITLFGLFCLQAVLAAPPSKALVEESAAPPWLTASENPTHLTFNQDWTLEKGTSYANNSYDTVGMFRPKCGNLLLGQMGLDLLPRAQDIEHFYLSLCLPDIRVTSIQENI